MNLALKPARLALIATAATLLAVDLICVGVLLSPASRSTEARRALADDLNRKLQTQRQDNQPLVNIEGKLVTAHEQIERFRLSSTVAADSELSEHLHKLAEGSHVKLQQASYAPHADQDRQYGAQCDEAGLRSTDISLQVGGSYEQLMNFVNALERSDKLLIVSDVQVRSGDRGAVGGLAINLQAFLRKERP